MQDKMTETSWTTTWTEQCNPDDAIKVRCELEAALDYSAEENMPDHTHTPPAVSHMDVAEAADATEDQIASACRLVL